MARQFHTPRTDTELLPLFEFSQVVNASLDLSFILDTLLLTLMGKLLATKAVVLLQKEGKTFSVVNSKGVAVHTLRHDAILPTTGNRILRVSETVASTLSESGIHLLFPIVSQRRVLGYFGISEHRQRRYTAHQKKFVNTLLSVSATAVEKGLAFDNVKTVNRSLDEKIHQLRTLFELAKEFSGILERDRLLKMFSLTLMGQVGTSRFAICLKEGTSIYSKIAGTYLESDKATIFDLVTAPMRVEAIPKRKKFTQLTDHLAKEKIVALVPLLLQNEVRGVLCLGQRIRGSSYSDSDLEFIFSLANLAFVSLENSRLFTETVEKKKLENELLIAREIQRGLLPRTIAAIKGFDIAGVNISSNQVGGDYYDVIPTEDGRFVIVIGDVSGKGTPASLLMANVQATVHALVPFNLELGAATARINDLIYRNTGADKFITFFWGILDPQTKIFRFVNAGHNPPLVVRRNGTIEYLSDGGLILGIMKTAIPYQEGQIQLHPGDCVIMYTDGVSEAMDTGGNDYTEERLEAFVTTLHDKGASAIISSIEHEIRTHTAGAPQSDDITLVVFKAQ